MRILVADDDPQILRALRITLAAKGYDILVAEDGAKAIGLAVDHNPDLFVIDLGMPNLDGLAVIQAVRGWSTAPILVVSGRIGAGDKVEALDAGADDYVTKPFSIEELLARIRALTRRIPQGSADPTVQLGAVSVDLASHSITRDTSQGREHIHLTPTEWRVLDLLVRNSGKLVTREMMLSQVWGTDRTTDSGYLRLYISQLRKKIEEYPQEPQYLITEAGMGYRLNLGE